MLNEFDIIKHYFKRHYNYSSHRKDVILGIGDDAALLAPPPGHILVTSMDTLITGVHFPVDTSPEDIGYKALAVSLSDLASMGADPAWIMLALSIPEENTKWLEGFCQGFFELSDQYGLELVGGDTTRGSLSISTQVMGFVPPDQAILRSTAQVGDKIFVTGTLGGAGLGLFATLNKVTIIPDNNLKSCLHKLNRPQARVTVGKALRGIASSMIDISDGLLADLGHIIKSSGVGAVVYLQDLPLDTVLKNTMSLEKAYSLALSSGDDYELCFTVPKERCEELAKIFANLNCPYSCIGSIEKKEIETGQGARVLDQAGKLFNNKYTGYQHF